MTTALTTGALLCSLLLGTPPPPAGPPLSLGEKLHYKGYVLGWIPVGDVWFEVTKDTHGGGDAYRIDARAQLRHDQAIDLDAAGGDELFAMAAGAGAGGGEELLEADAVLGFGIHHRILILMGWKISRKRASRMDSWRPS